MIRTDYRLFRKETRILLTLPAFRIKMAETNTFDVPRQTAVLVGLDLQDGTNFSKSIREMKELADAVSIDVVMTVTQSLPGQNAATYIGSGKVEEIRALVDELEPDLVLFDNSLSPIQLRNLANELQTEILDRTQLILRIFSERARTREAKLQVESAQLAYFLPRLVGLRTKLGRQGGTSGSMSNKGQGETQIELDRRHIEHRMAQLRRELNTVEQERATQRKRRASSGIPKVALVGYTNAGKSTIMNAMLSEFSTDTVEEKSVFEKNMLFATLDTSVRKIDPGQGRKVFLLSDTVGFISNLPTTLVKAFRSTLEEVKYADILLLVSDLSDSEYRENLRVTEETLSEIGAGDIPRIYVYNKADLASDPDIQVLHDPTQDTAPAPGSFSTPQSESSRRITISAKKRTDIERLVDTIEDAVNADRVECDMLIPYTDGRVLDALKKNSSLTISGYDEKGTKIHVFCTKADFNRYNEYVI